MTKSSFIFNVSMNEFKNVLRNKFSLDKQNIVLDDDDDDAGATDFGVVCSCLVLF